MKIVWKSNKNKNIQGVLEIFRKNFALTKSDKIIIGERFIPSVEGAKDSKEELICLLKLAAEIEHTLLVQYLYTAYSIMDDTSSIKSSIMTIAIQEMGHLLAVQNLLLRVGGIENLHLHKSLIRGEFEFKLLPYKLEPLSKGVLAKYVAVEASIDATLKDEKIRKIRNIALEEAGVAFNPVGGLYEKIFWLFQLNDEPVPNMLKFETEDENFRKGKEGHIKPEDFIPLFELQKFESESAHWKMGPMKTVMKSKEVVFSQVNPLNDLRNESLALVNSIALQGERADDTDGVKSHFELFLEAFDTFNQSAPSIIDIPINPFTKLNPELKKDKKKVQIENSYSLLWSSLFNKLYTSLLLDIHASFFYKQFNPDLPLEFVSLIRTNMRSLITKLTVDVLFKLPLLNGEFTFDKEPRCAPTFEIDDTFILNSEKTKVDQSNNNSISEIRNTISAIKSHLDFGNHNKARKKINEDSDIEADIFFLIEERYCKIKESIILNSSTS